MIVSVFITHYRPHFTISPIPYIHKLSVTRLIFGYYQPIA